MHRTSNGDADANTARYLLASYGVFGVMSPGLFGFGVSLAMERENGLLTLKRAMPMPPGAYLLGKMVMAMLAAAIVMLLLLALGIGLAHVQLGVSQALVFIEDEAASLEAIVSGATPDLAWPNVVWGFHL